MATGDGIIAARDAANGYSPIVPGVAGTVLTSNGTTSLPSYQAVGSGSVTHTGALTANNLVVGNGTADIKIAAATDGQVPIGKTSDGSVTMASISAGTGIAITPGAGTLSIAATGGTGTVTHTGALTANQLVVGNGTADIKVSDLTGDVTTSGGVATTIANSAVTYAKMQNVSANSKLLGSSATGSGAAPSEITVGTGLTMTASTLSSTVTGTVTTTGSPASGNLTKFSGTTSITNADLTGDVTTSGTEATTLATVNSNVGTFGDSSHVAQVTANAKGLITAVSNVTLTAGGLGGTTLLDTVGQLDIVNTVVDTTLYTFSVPGNSLGTTHSLHLVINGDILNNSGVARAITMTLIYGTTTLYKATSGTITSVARRACFFEIYLVAAGGTSAQEGTVRWLMPNSTGTGVTTGVGSMQSALLADGYGYGTSAENSTGALSLTFKIQLGAADANFSLRRQSAFLELL